MNLEILREKGWVVYECISGSHAYGLNIEGSDVDIRGIFIQPTEDILQGDYIEQVSDKKNDITFYEINRFIDLCATGNPNMLELLNVSEENVIFKDPIIDELFTPELKNKFITTKLKHTFLGYAFTQIKKARGLGKKINWDQEKMKRKTVLDFCYVLGEREQSIRFEKFKDINSRENRSTTPIYDEHTIVLSKVNNFPDMYTMYYLPGEGGMVAEGGAVESNEVRTCDIPKGNPPIGYVRFDRDAYSTHCKKYKEYTTWVENRNPQRYKDNLKGEQGYDHKNFLHCYRLLFMAKDVAEGRGIVVRRPEREFLLGIRNGELTYEDILAGTEKLMDEIAEIFDNSDLPRSFPVNEKRRLLKTIRLKYLNK
jgi:uncharacterized protein